jgi:excinuclease ABC subunit A
MRGYKPGRFSFNLRGGRCEACEGDGLIKIEMNFLPDVYIECEECKGKRYNRETLEVKYKGKSIADVLDMSVEEAMALFEHIPSIQSKLEMLSRVGLDYVKLGQSATTLSGGEAQRIKLTRELAKRATGKTLYLLDEPTTGLHFDDTKKLIKVLDDLVEKGNTVVVIEHNLDVIKSADHLIDIGPEGGDAGGEIVATGTPEQVAAVPESYTGQFLKAMLAKKAS